MAELTEDEMKKVFKKFDANGDRKISPPAEVAEALRSLGDAPTATGLDDIKSKMAEIDTDGDGYIDYGELVAFRRAHLELAKDVAKIC